LADVRPISTRDVGGEKAKRSVNSIHYASHEDGDGQRAAWSDNGVLIGVITEFVGRGVLCRTVSSTGGDPVNPRIKTTVVGSYPVRSWLVGNASRLVEGRDLFEGRGSEFPASEQATVSVNFFTARAGASGRELVASSAASRA
jgi:hypothetical protein